MFDSSVFFATNARRSWEPFFDGDSIIGEPFDDINGNGVYDPGVDIFIRSVDTTINDDVNFNGEHDGPNDPWSPGVPFDDLDLDGQYDRPSNYYDQGEPFLDLNGDGVCNSASEIGAGLGDLIRWVVSEQDTSFTIWTYELQDSVGLLVSDSGISYATPARSSITWNDTEDRPQRYYDHQFRIDEHGLAYLCRIQPYRSEVQVVPVILAVESDCFAKRISVPVGCSPYPPQWQEPDSTLYRRTIINNATFEFDGILYDSLLQIRLDDGWINGDSTVVCQLEWDFYFKQEHGIFALVTGSHRVCFPVRYDTIPLPMTR